MSIYTSINIKGSYSILIYGIQINHNIWKISYLNFSILAFSTNSCPIKSDLSGDTVLPQASGCLKLVQMEYFYYLYWTFVHSKCKRSSLRSQCWMRKFSNTVIVVLLLFKYCARIELSFKKIFTMLSFISFSRYPHLKTQRWSTSIARDLKAWTACSLVMPLFEFIIYQVGLLVAPMTHPFSKSQASTIFWIMTFGVQQ